ncbi:MAG: YwaF family protein, partial [Clostridia bacterium]|nr:YwaF family protein [Clostridia bacterium]
MKDWFLSLFQDDFGGLEITLFSVWHIDYLIIIIGEIFTTNYFLSKKSQETKKKVVDYILIYCIITYFCDLFAMPFYLDKIDIDKLPFHICTSVSIIAQFTNFNKKFEKLKTPVVVLSFVAPLMYLTYPGSALGGVSPFCYRVVQTFLFHGSLLAYGVLSITTKQVELDIKKVWKELVIITCIACWASLGNALYETSTHHYDWFFLTGSTFPFVPKFLMPFAVIVA